MKHRADVRRGRTPRSNGARGTLIAGGMITLVILGMVLLRWISSDAPQGASPDPTEAVLELVTGVTADIGNRVGQGSVVTLPVQVPGTTLVGSGGKPRIIYMGAEFCPFCASQRWGIIVALSRFGSFSGVGASHSATDDVFPNTPTFTFHGSHYTSDYVQFEPVELRSNVKVGGVYQALETPTAEQNALLDQYSRPPYVPAGSAGSIPFLNLANRYIVAGASYSPSLLAGKSSGQIASQLSNPDADTTRAIVGTANVLTAAICIATANNPASVCAQPSISQIQSKLR